MKTVQTLSLLTLTTAALAQTPQTGIEKGTFGMAKATLEFLATDTKTFPKAKETTCKDCQDYSDLSAFIQANSLKKADGLVNDIKKHSLKLNDDFAADAFTSEGAVLDSLRRYVVARVTSGPERAHRKQLPSFTAYQTKMTALAGKADPEQAVNEQTAALQENDTPTVTEEATATTGGGSSLGTWAFWLALLNLLGLGYLWLTRQPGSRPKPAQSDRDDARIAGLQDENSRLSSTVADLASRLTTAEKKLAAVPNAVLAAQNAATAQAQPRPNPTPNQPVSQGQGVSNVPRTDVPRTDVPRTEGVSQERPANQPRPNPAYGNQPNPSAMPTSGMSQMPSPGQPSASTPPSSPPPSNVRPTPAMPSLPNEAGRTVSGGGTPGAASAANVPATPMNSPQGTIPSAVPPTVPAAPAAPPRRYARTADLGNGFSVAGLLNEPERGTVYELDLTSPGTATFRVSQTPEAQQLAMSDPYSYLSDACLYENQPGGPNSRIQTVAPGQLVLQGDKWQITEKARIGFV